MKKKKKNFEKLKLKNEKHSFTALLHSLLLTLKITKNHCSLKITQKSLHLPGRGPGFPDRQAGARLQGHAHIWPPPILAIWSPFGR